MRCAQATSTTHTEREEGESWDHRDAAERRHDGATRGLRGLRRDESGTHTHASFIAMAIDRSMGTSPTDRLNAEHKERPLSVAPWSRERSWSRRGRAAAVASWSAGLVGTVVGAPRRTAPHRTPHRTRSPDHLVTWPHYYLVYLVIRERDGSVVAFEHARRDRPGAVRLQRGRPLGQRRALAAGAVRLLLAEERREELLRQRRVALHRSAHTQISVWTSQIIYIR